MTQGDNRELLYRWFRYVRRIEDGSESIILYSGDRGPTPYAAYRLERTREGTYGLFNHRSAASIATARTLEGVLAELPNDFYSN